MNHEAIESLTMEQKIDLLLKQSSLSNTKLTSIELELQTIRTKQDTITKTTNTIKHEHTSVKQQLYATQGKLAKVQDRQNELQLRLVHNEYREMQDRLVFYNIPDQKKETPQTLKVMLYQLINNDMGVPLNQIFHSTNPAGEIRIDYCHRIGKPTPQGGRPIVVKFVTKAGRDIVYDPKYIKNLKTKEVKISEQYPAEIREKRSALIPTL